MASLRTPLCDLLKIDTPIVQAPIGPATTPTMTAAVSNAGGLGMLAFLRRDADDVHRLISETHELTDRPFGGNFILRGLEGTDDRLDACLESGVDVASFHWDEPYDYVERVHSAGALLMYTVGDAEAARRAVAAGVDIIVAQGWEAGGHVRGYVAGSRGRGGPGPCDLRRQHRRWPRHGGRTDAGSGRRMDRDSVRDQR